MRFLGYKMRTVQEIRQKLLEKEFAEDVIAQVLAFLEKYGYADDREYCRRYIREKLRLKPKSGYALGLELRRGAFPPVSLRKCLRKRRLTRRAMPCGGWRKKAADNWPPENEKKKKQLFDFLLRKGYSYDIIKEAFRQMEERR